MAITKLLRIKETTGTSKSSHLKKNIFYICREDKTSGGVLIGGNAGCSPEIIYRTMMENKQKWGKETGSQGFHYVISFPPDCGINEQTALKIAEEFCKELLHDDFYYAVAVHNDREHIHAHITFDSVSFTDGLKFHSPKGDWKKRIQPITDRLCEKYNLPTLDYDEDRRGRNYGEWKHEKQNDEDMNYTWTDIIRDDIDEAIHYSENYEEFISYLKNDGYKISRDGKYLSLLPDGAKRAYRTGRLGKGYSKEEIIQRISDKALYPEIDFRYKTYGNRVELRKIIYAKIEKNPGWKMSACERQFWKRWNNTYFLRKPERLTFEKRQQIKKDVLEVQNLSDSIRYMIQHNMEDEPSLVKRKTELENERDALKRDVSVKQTRIYKNQMFMFVNKCEKLKKECDANPSSELFDKIAEFTDKVESICPYDEALKQWSALKEEIGKTKDVLRDCQSELKIVDETLRLFYQMDIPSEKSENVNINHTHGERGDFGNYTKVTVNEKLFVDMNADDNYVTRIPYSRLLVSFPKEDCSLSDSGEILTVYIYDDRKYKVSAGKGGQYDLISGSELKTKYEDKTMKKGVSKNNGRKANR